MVMISLNHTSGSSHRASRKQIIEFKIKEIDLQLSKLAAERLELKKQLDKVNATPEAGFRAEVIRRAEPEPEKKKYERRPWLTPEQRREYWLEYARNYAKMRREMGSAYIPKNYVKGNLKRKKTETEPTS